MTSTQAQFGRFARGLCRTGRVVGAMQLRKDSFCRPRKPADHANHKLVAICDWNPGVAQATNVACFMSGVPGSASRMLPFPVDVGRSMSQCRSAEVFRQWLQDQAEGPRGCHLPMATMVATRSRICPITRSRLNSGPNTHRYLTRGSGLQLLLAAKPIVSYFPLFSPRGC